MVEREVATDWLVQSDGPYVAALDPVLTPELRLEGIARELVHLIQRLRKEAGFDFSARISLSITGGPDILSAALNHRSSIAAETLAREFKVGEVLRAADRQESFDIEGQQVTVAVKQLSAGAAPA